MERFRDQNLRKHPLCAYYLADGRPTAASVVDHDLPHGHDPALRVGKFTGLAMICIAMFVVVEQTVIGGHT
ncbi:hypothetical protein [Rhodobacter sp. 24-YEA-8]|uniref:hypothetical protein n=1 Tax=Rhodobacter sp. 24-YEA-8 TaxID=1884310 RepID=UPI000B80D68A|nr:hypothetical protein [Rhodobacter sp. 24-YEA-8]